MAKTFNIFCCHESWQQPTKFSYIRLISSHGNDLKIAIAAKSQVKTLEISLSPWDMTVTLKMSYYVCFLVRPNEAMAVPCNIFLIDEVTKSGWYASNIRETQPSLHRLLDLAFQPCVGKQRVPYNPSLHPRSYKFIRLESASCPVLSDKEGQEIRVSQIILNLNTILIVRPNSSICIQYSHFINTE